MRLRGWPATTRVGGARAPDVGHRRCGGRRRRRVHIGDRVGYRVGEHGDLGPRLHTGRHMGLFAQCGYMSGDASLGRCRLRVRRACMHARRAPGGGPCASLRPSPLFASRALAAASSSQQSAWDSLPQAQARSWEGCSPCARAMGVCRPARACGMPAGTWRPGARRAACPRWCAMQSSRACAHPGDMISCARGVGRTSARLGPCY